VASTASFLRAARQPRRRSKRSRERHQFHWPERISNQERSRSDGSCLLSDAHASYAQQHYRNAGFLVGTGPPDYEMSRRLQAPSIKLVAVQLPVIRAGIDLLDHDQSYDPRAGVWREFENAQAKS
jgi:hypothetical protein